MSRFGLRASGKDAQIVLHWLGWADQDYVAARLLLLRGLVVQGTAIANTAVEKYLKAVCSLAKIPFNKVGHSLRGLNGLLYKRGYELRLRTDFLKHLEKAYRLRYPDELMPGFNIALNSIAILVELDLTVDEIRKGLEFKQTHRPQVVTKLEGMRDSWGPELLTNNCALGGADIRTMFQHPSWSYDLRVTHTGDVIECFYAVEKLTDGENFKREGLKPAAGSEGKSFNLAWTPWQRPSASAGAAGGK